MPGSFNLEFREHVIKTFKKLEKRDKKQLETIRNKITEICNEPYKFKPLGAPMQRLRRVHILKSFVLVYSVNEVKHTVVIEDYAHHDEVY